MYGIARAVGVFSPHICTGLHMQTRIKMLAVLSTFRFRRSNAGVSWTSAKSTLEPPVGRTPPWITWSKTRISPARQSLRYSVVFPSWGLTPGPVFTTANHGFASSLSFVDETYHRLVNRRFLLASFPPLQNEEDDTEYDLDAKNFLAHASKVAFIRRIPAWVSTTELGRQVGP